jgi:hypothetical protein
MKSLRIGMLTCLMLLTVLTLQVQAADENFNGFTTLNYNNGPLLNYTQANAAPYNTPAGGWIFSGTGSSFGLAPTGGPDGSQYITRANTSQTFASSFAYVAKVDKALTGTHKIAFDLLFAETTPGSGKGTFCLKVHGINPVPAGGAWAGYLEIGGGTGTGGPSAATRYWDGVTDAVPSDGARLLFVASSTTNGATLAITRSTGWQHYEFDVNLGTGYEWITINFGHNYEVAPTVAPALLFGVDNVVFPLLARGQAHTPVPSNGNSHVDKTAVTSVSWYSPEQDILGNSKDDPNIVSVNGYNVYFRTTEPNALTDAPVSTSQAGQSWTITPALAYDTTYYWRVDTSVTWDSNSFTGTTSKTAIMKGTEWQFKTKPNYIAPAVKFDNVRTALPLLPATLAPSITGNTLPITSVTFTLLTDDYEFPAGAIATLTPANPMDNQNPTATLTTDKAGKYKVKLAVTDGNVPLTTVQTIAEVMVYATTCEARKATTGWTANYYDRAGDCLVSEPSDLTIFAQNWLNDTTMKAQGSYAKQGVYVPADIIIEAENVYDPNDPNYVSNPPFDATGTTGDPRIVNEGYASGGKIVAYTAANHFLSYQITIPTAGAYTVSVMNAFPSGAARSIALGTVSPDGNPSNDAITAYGSIPLSNGTGFGGGSAYFTQYKLDSAVINFTAGTHIVRMTWVGGGANVDFIALKKN